MEKLLLENLKELEKNDWLEIKTAYQEKLICGKFIELISDMGIDTLYLETQNTNVDGTVTQQVLIPYTYIEYVTIMKNTDTHITRFTAFKNKELDWSVSIMKKTPSTKDWMKELDIYTDEWFSLSTSGATLDAKLDCPPNLKMMINENGEPNIKHGFSDLYKSMNHFNNPYQVLLETMQGKYTATKLEGETFMDLIRKQDYVWIILAYGEITKETVSASNFRSIGDASNIGNIFLTENLARKERYRRELEVKVINWLMKKHALSTSMEHTYQTKYQIVPFLNVFCQSENIRNITRTVFDQRFKKYKEWEHYGDGE